MSNHEGQLTNELRRRAEALPTGTLELDDVRSRARSIRRRRTATGVVAAVAVLGVAIPTSLALTEGMRDSSAPPVAGSPTPAPDDTETPLLPRKLDLTEPTADGLRPEIAYLTKLWVRPDGTAQNLAALSSDSSPYWQLTSLGETWLAARSDGGGDVLDVLDGSGTVTRSVPSYGGLAVSADGTVAAYVDRDGVAHTLTDADGDLAISAPGALPEGATVAAVSGSTSCKEGSEGGGCGVWANSRDKAFLATSQGVTEWEGDLSVSDVSSDGKVAGVLSRTDGGSCSVVRGEGGGRLWRTCDYSLGRFSPDGTRILAYPAYYDGLGPSTAAVLDARTGDRLVALLADPANKGAGHFGDLVWENDDNVLASVWSTKRWRVVRVDNLSQVQEVPVAGVAPQGEEQPSVRFELGR